MYTVTRDVEASPEQVWAVLEDGWLYSSWVVGASRMRAVDPRFPAPGARLHHSAGVWPVVLNDETVVLESEAPRRLRLQAKGWPAGEATIELRVEPHDGGSRVTIAEEVTRGPSLVVPAAVRQPLIALRNTESLRRLAYQAERRSEPDSVGGPSAGSKASLHKSRMHTEPGKTI